MNRLTFEIETPFPVMDKKTPTAEEIQSSVQFCKSQSLGMRLVSFEDGQSKDELSLKCENGAMMMILWMPFHEDPLCEHSTLSNPNWESENLPNLFYQDHSTLGKVPMVEMGGNYWDARSFTRDIQLVKDIFSEFFDTGKISHSWMQP